MGLFLSMSGVIGASSENVLKALQEFAKQKSNVCKLAEGTTDDPGIGVITKVGQNTTILYPADFMEWDDASQHLSSVLSMPVFSFHIHDGDFWMYVLFRNGEEIGHFNPVPEYWEELTPEEKDKWKGDVSSIIELVPGTSAEAIKKYLIEWDLEQENEIKAYPDDEFAICDCWQICDFMKKLELQYPMGDDGSILGTTFYMGDSKKNVTSQPDSPNSGEKKHKQKQWWQFWK